MTSTTITPIEIDGQFYVSVILDGHEKRYGPYSDTEAAETMAARFVGICRGVFHQQVAICVLRQPAAKRRLDEEIRQWAKSSTCIASWRTSRMTN